MKLPYWILPVLFMAGPAFRMGKAVRRRIASPGHRPGHCAQCGYDLRAHNPGNKCPECGRVIRAAS